MNNQNQTEAKTSKRMLVIFRDCHVKNNIVVPIESSYEERFYRHFAHRMGWPCTIRKPKAHTELQSRPEVRRWRKPTGIEARPRPKLGGAFRLELSPIAKEGGAV